MGGLVDKGQSAPNCQQQQSMIAMRGLLRAHLNACATADGSLTLTLLAAGALLSLLTACIPAGSVTLVCVGLS